MGDSRTVQRDVIGDEQRDQGNPQVGRAPEDTSPLIRSPANERSPSGIFVADHIIIVRPGLYVKDENRPKGLNM